MTEKYVKGKMMELIQYAAKMNKETGGIDAVALSQVEYEHLVKDLGQAYFPGTMAREMTVNGVKVTTIGV